MKTISKEQKKEYHKPEMTIVDMDEGTSLLCSSCEIDTIWDNSEPSEN